MGLEMVKIVVDNAKCTGCGTCVDTCPVAVYEVKDKKSVPVKTDECLVCRACEVQCPEAAIQVIE
jgi:NAD-dependent dihydropyrimidine dehydrogenase PreA subunit